MKRALAGVRASVPEGEEGEIDPLDALEAAVEASARARGPHANFHPAGTPWSLYIGGICGFVIILSLAFVFPKIGAALAVALVVLGQSAAALAIDHYGLMGMPRDPVSLSRIAGLALVVGGVALLRS